MESDEKILFADWDVFRHIGALSPPLGDDILFPSPLLEKNIVGVPSMNGVPVTPTPKRRVPIICLLDEDDDQDDDDDEKTNQRRRGKTARIMPSTQEDARLALGFLNISESSSAATAQEEEEKIEGKTIDHTAVWREFYMGLIEQACIYALQTTHTDLVTPETFDYINSNKIWLYGIYRRERCGHVERRALISFGEQLYELYWICSYRCNQHGELSIYDLGVRMHDSRSSFSDDDACAAPSNSMRTLQAGLLGAIRMLSHFKPLGYHARNAAALGVCALLEGMTIFLAERLSDDTIVPYTQLSADTPFTRPTVRSALEEILERQLALYWVQSNEEARCAMMARGAMTPTVPGNV